MDPSTTSEANNMWEMTLFTVAAFMGGWGIRGIIERKRRSRQVGKPEMMWFNDEKSKWERITSMQLHVADRAVVTIPVKLVKQSEEYENR
jgi:hypothetical protein